MFIGFLNRETIIDKHIREAILKFYPELGLDVKECKREMLRATNMQPNKKGVYSFILRKALNLTATHYCSHKLNISLAAHCNLAIIDNV